MSDQLSHQTIDCRSEVGITIGLVDAVIAICRILAKRDLAHKEVQEALKDFRGDEDLRTVLNAATSLENGEQELIVP